MPNNRRLVDRLVNFFYFLIKISHSFSKVFTYPLFYFIHYPVPQYCGRDIQGMTYIQSYSWRKYFFNFYLPPISLHKLNTLFLRVFGEEGVDVCTCSTYITDFKRVSSSKSRTSFMPIFNKIISHTRVVAKVWDVPKH